MRSVIPRRLLSLAGLAGLASLAAGFPTAATAAAPPAPVAPAVAPATGAPTAGTQPVFLINGTRMALTPAPGGPVAAVLRSSLPRPQQSFLALITVKMGGQVVDVPLEALPLIGHGLDPGLFAVDTLARVERGGRLPVRVTYHGPRPPALPGVIITHAASGTADGYLTAKSAATFGAALRHEFLAGHEHASAGNGGPFAHGLSIALAGGPTAPHRSPPRFAMHTLTVRGTNQAGQPDNGDVVTVINADNEARFAGGSQFTDGVTKLSVPAGHYWAVAEFATGNSLRLAVVPQFTVSAKPGARAGVHLDERSATSKITVATPRPATAPLPPGFAMVRTSPSAAPGLFALPVIFAPKGFSVWVSPTTKKPTVGSLRSFTSQQFLSPDGAAVPYVYNLNIPGPPGLIPPQHFKVRQSSLATVDERYFQDGPSSGSWVTFGTTTAQARAGDGGLAMAEALDMPGRQIQYMTADPSVLWSTEFWGHDASDGQSEAFRSLRPGQTVTDEWNRYPLHPGPDVSLSPARESIFEQLPSAARTGDVLSLVELAFGDNTRGHFGRGFATDPSGNPTGRWEIDQNGIKLAAGDGFTDIAPVKLSARPSVIKFTETAARTSPHFLLSAASTTTWTWRSHRDPKATVPAPWECRTGSSITTGLTHQCAVQPMMTLRYQVAGLALDGSAPGGRQTIGITAGHIQLGGSPAITGAAARVSFDGGKTWQPAKVTKAGPGRFRAVFSAPAGSFVTMRVSATDAAGGSVTETITRAYKVAS